MRSFLLGILISSFAICADAAYHLFRIDQVYSNADGSVQYVVMREITGTTNNEHLWAGHVLQATDSRGQQKTLVFPAHLRTTQTAGRSVLVATPDFAALNIVAPDYIIPARFLPTDGGMLDFASIDRIMLPILPADGVTAVDRTGGPLTATPKNFSNATATVPPLPVTSVEFYNQTLDHYFISALAPDIEALDSQRFQGWVRTGLSFRVYPSQAAGPTGTPVCRIIIPPDFGDSHFFGRSAQECGETLTKFPFMSQETASAFFINLPADGICPIGTVPVYRVFSNRGDANHRYTTDRSVRDQMVARGWTAEGDGPDLVVMCAPGAM